MLNPQSSSASKSTKFKKVFSDTEQSTKKLLFSNNNNKDKIDNNNNIINQNNDSNIVNLITETIKKYQ